MKDFIYDIPTKVYFGDKMEGNLGAELSKFGKKVLLVYGGGSIKKSGLYDAVKQEIKAYKMELYELGGVEPNPRVTTVNFGAEICRKIKIDVILAVGGGSVIDCAKVIGVAAYYEKDAWDIVTCKVNINNCLPIFTVLTMSATGSEMNFNAVISNQETEEKIGYKYPLMRPKVSFLDPRNTFSVGAFQTACGGTDILSHIMEDYFCNQGNMYILDSIMEGLMKTVIKYTPIAIKEPNNYEARANLMWASSLALNGLIKGGKTHAWSCHAMEHQLSAVYDITHGLGLAILTPRWMEYVLDEKTVDRFFSFGTNVFDIDISLGKQEVSLLAIAKLKDFLYNKCGLIPSLKEIGIDNLHFKKMAEKAVTLNNYQIAFKNLSAEDVKNIYEKCL